MSDEIEQTDGSGVPAGPDFSNMSDEELDAVLGNVQADEEGNLPGQIEVGEPEEKAKDEEPEEASAEAEADEEPEAEEEETDEEEEKDEDEEDVDLRKVLARLETLELERERLSADLERERLLRDRNAGKLGALLQQLEKTKKGTAKAASEFDEGDADDDERDDPKKAASSELEKELTEIRTERTQRAINGACQDFYQENYEFFEALERSAGKEVAEQFQADLIEKLQKQQAEFGENLQEMSPKMAAKVAKTLIRSAYTDLRIEKMRDLQAKASEASEKSRQAVRARKKGAAGVKSAKVAGKPSGSGKNKPLSQMSDDELDAQLRAVAAQLE